MHQNIEDYKLAYGNFGLYPSDAWVAVNAGPLWNRGQRKYTGWIRMHTEATSPPQAQNSLAQMTIFDRSVEETAYFKSWHWFFRWVMAGRTIEAVRRSMWDMIRMRVRDILAINVSIATGEVAFEDTLGAIFTSERAAAILLRWHIFRPAHVTGSRVRNSIAAAINASRGVAWHLPRTQWTNEHESALLVQLLADANEVNDTQTALSQWPNYPGRSGRNYVLGDELGVLSADRNSFALDTWNI